MTEQKYTYEDFIWLQEIFERNAKHWISRSNIQSVDLSTCGYKEPGYSDPESGLIARGNWNSATEWDRESNQRKNYDDSPARFAKVLEALDVELQWCDEWIECEECCGLIRCQPDSYGWTPSYVQGPDGQITCHECIQEDAESYLESLEGRGGNANTLDIDPGDHGYQLIADNFESGFHRGQDADPALIAKLLEEAGFERFIFNIDSKGQFDMRFSVWLHDDEAGGEGLALAKRVLEQGSTDGPSIAAAMEAQLKAAARQPDPPGEGGVVVREITPDGVEAKRVSHQDFLDGKMPK